MRPIDADELIDELSLVYDIREAEDDPYNIGVMAAIAKVKQRPTIEPKHGRWIDVSGATICSWCSSNSEMEHYFRKGYRADYCPMCGARMDEDER